MTQDSAGIVERLRESAAYDSYGPDRVRLDIREEAAAHIEAQAVEIEKMREQLARSATRFAYCAAMIESGHAVSGIRRLEQVEKARHFSDEALAALKGTKP